MSCCPSKKTIGKVITGTAYLMFGINEELSKRRMKICRNCVHLKSGSCEICGCDMAKKTRLPAEICPHKTPKWLPEFSS